MLVTEKEAAILVCPRKVDLRCQGSRCMGWRWAKREMNLDSYTTAEAKRALGFCGHAGRPVGID